MALSITRNPNLTRPQSYHAQLGQSSDPISKPHAASENERVGTSPNEVQAQFGADWWTGRPPEKCPGFDRERNCLVALPLLNLDICSRQDILDYFDNTWTLTELLFQGLKTESAFTRPPYHQLRHPMIFYYGHPAVLFVNKLRLAGMHSEPLNLYLEKVLETGVDEMSWDDLSKNEMNWPSVASVHAYRKKVYGIIRNTIETNPELEHPGKKDRLIASPLWALWMGFEHEKIHFETSSVLIRELPIEVLEVPKFWPPLHPSAAIAANAKKSMTPQGADVAVFQWQNHQAQKVRIGKPFEAESYGWDNEYGERQVEIKKFQFTETQVTNGQYYEFVSTGAYIRDEFWSAEGLEWRKFRNTKRPTFWAAVGPEGAHEYELRTIFEYIPMPWSWPVEVNFHEAQAFARWKNQVDKSPLHYRMLTEAEFVSFRKDPRDPVLQIKPYREYKDPTGPVAYNFNLQWGSAGPADDRILGNTWTWLEDQFNPLPGFQVHRLYDDFSTPCYDGKHQMILGGSFISCGHEASQWARFHFRPHFYQHSGFRLAASLDGSGDNGAVRLLKETEYLHPRRQSVLDQLQTDPQWWQKVEQPMELTSDEFQNLFAITQKNIFEYDQDYASMHPMGSAHDPSLNSVPTDFTLPYQTTKNFPAHPEKYDKLLQFVFKEMAPLSQLPGHPGYAAYVAGSGNMISNLAQLIAQTLNPFTGHYMMAPGLVTLETEVIQWFINLMQFPEKTAGGFLTTGSSLASLSAIAMARQKKLTSKDYSKVSLYVSDQAHHCLAKAWVTLGFDGDNIRLIPTTRPDFKMDVEQLEKTLRADLAWGLKPLMIVGSAGTTNTGAVDPLAAIAKLARTNDIWFHVDGAYGALFKLSPKTNATFAGLELADSIVFDLHKALGLSYGTGCLLVREKADMRFAYPGAKSYMPPEIGEGDLESELDRRVDFADITPELSRDYRGLRVWLPLKAWGIGPFVLNLEEKLKLSEWVLSELKKIPHVQIVAAPQLSIQAFTLNVGEDLARNNAATQELLERINQRGTLFVSACQLDGKKSIRLCLLGFRMHYPRLDQALSEMREMIADIASGGTRREPVS